MIIDRCVPLVESLFVFWLALYPDTVMAITRGANDSDSPEANVVVQLTGAAGGLCTGTLISPLAVLTAKHCITGDNFSGQNIFGGGGGKTGLALPLTVTLGNPLGKPLAVYQSLGAPAVLGDNGAVNDQEAGSDVAIVWLNPAPWANNAASAPFQLVSIIRPELASPTPSDGDDSEGGDYNVPIGMSGWSPNSNHDAAYRQVAYYGAIYHYPGYPGGGPGTPSGQYWVHAQGAGNLEGGDSGGPLFWKKSDGVRQVLGVAHGIFNAPFAIDGFDCTFNKCDLWTDVTRGNIALWIRQQMIDTSRSPKWVAAHGGKIHWKGEVDYTGLCNADRDWDCDHIYNEHDNCPTVYNPDQREDVVCPPPTTYPLSCRSVPPPDPISDCNDVALQCNSQRDNVVLEQLTGSGWVAIQTWTRSSAQFSPTFLLDQKQWAGQNVTFRFCSFTDGGKNCGPESLNIVVSTTNMCAPMNGGFGSRKGCQTEWCHKKVLAPDLPPENRP